MSTKIRPELSTKNEYWIERHRYYELKHFCLQYPIWKKAYAQLDCFSSRQDISVGVQTNSHSNPTEKFAMTKLFYSERIEMIEKVAKDANETLSCYILKGVTEGVSYDYLKAMLEIPCCKDTYYETYRKFFWLLDKVRN